MKICLHKYKLLENGNKDKICIKCGKLKYPRWMRWVLFKMDFTTWLWKTRGLQTCPIHGFHAQSYITGYCKKCKRKTWTKKEIDKFERDLESIKGDSYY